jgi:hypothetical protein
VAISLSISPDDATVLVAGEGQIAVLARDRITGTLTAPSSGARCFNAAVGAGCERLLYIPDDVRNGVYTAFAPDGRAIYVTYPGFTSDIDEQGTEVVTLFRDERGGLHGPPQFPSVDPVALRRVLRRGSAYL